MGMTTHVSVATMRGVTAGSGDIDFGYNVTVPKGQKLSVMIELKGEKVAFAVQIPRRI